LQMRIPSAISTGHIEAPPYLAATRTIWSAYIK